MDFRFVVCCAHNIDIGTVSMVMYGYVCEWRFSIDNNELCVYGYDWGVVDKLGVIDDKPNAINFGAFRNVI